jgi:REP element-mobilizing transposase RayT
MAQPPDDYPYDDYGFEKFENSSFPLAYLLTFTTYGTWLHGDDRASHERSRDERFGTRRRESNRPLMEKMRSELSEEPVRFNQSAREIVTAAIEEVCRNRDYLLRAINVRTNHAHVVASKAIKPEKMVNEFKAYSTRRLREAYLATPDGRVWTRGASTRYLWKPEHVNAAIEYVLYSQGDTPPGTVISLP